MAARFSSVWVCVCVYVFVCGVCVVCGNVYGNGGKADGAESVAVVLLCLCVLTKCMLAAGGKQLLRHLYYR